MQKYSTDAKADNVNNILMNKKNFLGSITRDSELLVKLFAYYYDDVITTHVIFIHTYIHFYVQCFIFVVVNLCCSLHALVSVVLVGPTLLSPVKQSRTLGFLFYVFSEWMTDKHNAQHTQTQWN